MKLSLEIWIFLSLTVCSGCMADSMNLTCPVRSYVSTYFTCEISIKLFDSNQISVSYTFGKQEPISQTVNVSYSINDTACQLTAMNEQGSSKLTTESVNYSLGLLTNDYIILSSAKFAYDMFVNTIEFYSVKAADIVFYLASVDCITNSNCLNETNATNFKLLYAYKVSTGKGYNLVNFNQYTIKNTVLMVDYYFNLIMGLPSKRTNATIMDIYLTGNGEMKSMDFKYNVTVSGFKIAYIYKLSVSNQIITQGNHNVTAAVSNSSLTAYARVFMNIPLEVYVNFSCPDSFIIGISDFCLIYVMRNWQTVRISIDYKKNSAKWYNVLSDLKTTRFNNKLFYTETFPFSVNYENIGWDVLNLYFWNIYSPYERIFVANYSTIIVSDTNLTVSCEPYVYTGESATCQVTVFTERTSLGVLFAMTSSPYQKFSQNLAFNFSSNGFRFGALDSFFSPNSSSMFATRLILSNTQLTKDAFVKSFEFMSSSNGSMIVKISTLGCNLSNATCIQNIETSNLINDLNSYNISVRKGYNMYTLPRRLRATTGCVVRIETSDVVLTFNKTRRLNFTEYYYDPSMGKYNRYNPSLSANFIINADRIINTETLEVSTVFNQSSVVYVTATLNLTSLKNSTKFIVYPLANMINPFLADQLYQVGLLHNFLFILTIGLPLKTFKIDFMDDQVVNINLTTYNFDVSFGSTSYLRTATSIYMNYFEANTQFIFHSTEIYIDTIVDSLEICSYLNQTVNVSIISFPDCYDVLESCASYMSNLTKMADYKILNSFQLNLQASKCKNYTLDEYVVATRGSMIALDVSNFVSIPITYYTQGSLNNTAMIWNMTSNSLAPFKNMTFNIKVFGEKLIKKFKLNVNKLYARAQVYRVLFSFVQLNITNSFDVNIVYDRQISTPCTKWNNVTINCVLSMSNFDLPFSAVVNFIEVNSTLNFESANRTFDSYYGPLVSYNLTSADYDVLGTFILVNTEFPIDNLLQGFKINALSYGTVNIKVVKLDVDCGESKCADYLRYKNFSDIKYKNIIDYQIKVTPGVIDYRVDSKYIEKGSLMIVSFYPGVFNQRILALASIDAQNSDLTIINGIVTPMPYQTFAIKCFTKGFIFNLVKPMQKDVLNYVGYLNVEILVYINNSPKIFKRTNFTFYIDTLVTATKPELTSAFTTYSFTTNQNGWMSNTTANNSINSSLASTLTQQINFNYSQTHVSFTSFSYTEDNQTESTIRTSSSIPNFNLNSTYNLTDADVLHLFDSLGSLSSNEYRAASVLLATYSDDLSGCLANCSNKGYCHFDDNKKLICTCWPDYSGSSCQKDIRPCSEDPCLNDGICAEYLNLTTGEYHFNCSCGSLYYGKNCEQKVDLCANVSCSQNGYCQFNSTNSTSCKCFTSYYGTDCELENDWSKTVKQMIKTTSVIAIVTLVIFYLLFVVSDVTDYFIQLKHAKKKPYKTVKKRMIHLSKRKPQSNFH